METATDSSPALADALAELERLRARVAELEAAAALHYGTMGVAEPRSETISFTWNVPPNAPGHEEDQP